MFEKVVVHILGDIYNFLLIKPEERLSINKGGEGKSSFKKLLQGNQQVIIWFQILL